MNDKCVAQVMAVAEGGAFRIYVAWEWEDVAKKGMFGICRSEEKYPYVTKRVIEETADYGQDISGTDEARKIFANLL